MAEYEEPEIKNAIIEYAKFDTERGLTAYIGLDYGNGEHQAFGGYQLYTPRGWASHGDYGNYAGHFIWRVMEIAGVEEWSRLPGKTVRARSSRTKVYAIGHIVKNDWFEIGLEFEQLKMKDKAGAT